VGRVSSHRTCSTPAIIAGCHHRSILQMACSYAFTELALLVPIAHTQSLLLIFAQIYLGLLTFRLASSYRMHSTISCHMHAYSVNQLGLHCSGLEQTLGVSHDARSRSIIQSFYIYPHTVLSVAHLCYLKHLIKRQNLKSQDRLSRRIFHGRQCGQNLLKI